MAASKMINETKAWRDIEELVREVISKRHLRDMLSDASRDEALCAEHDGLFLDYARQKVDERVMDRLFDLADAANVHGKIVAMRSGAHLNTTEDRAVMHVALRADPGDEYVVDGRNVVPDVLEVRKRIADFARRVRDGSWPPAAAKTRITDVVCIGIGGSYLGCEFVAEALRTDPEAQEAAAGRRLRFLANVDPVDVSRALEGLNPATTLVVVISKTFTTAETMLNAKTLRKWLVDALGPAEVGNHMVAVSAAVSLATAFGIAADNVFGFWDWVGGRYSVTSAVGVLPLALHFGPEQVDRFLRGARSLDQHFFFAPPRANLPMLLGLLGVYNTSFLGHSTRCLAPYSQALHRFAAHVQQVDMESNGKRVTADGRPLPFAAGEVDFGEPGTNGQHSFFQLLHQGRVVPVDFIGFRRSQQPQHVPGEKVSNHDELMSNFLAQPDALACGQTAEQLRASGVPDAEVPHRVMTGDRPSNVLLLEQLDAYAVGQLLALYEHRTAVEGFVWGINSFDQMGVELGKKLAVRVRGQLESLRGGDSTIAPHFNPSTRRLLERYVGPKL